MGVPGQSYQEVGVPGQSYQEVGVPGQSYQEVGVPGQSYQEVGVSGQSYQEVGVSGLGSGVCRCARTEISCRRRAYLDSKEEGNEAKDPAEKDHGYHREDDVIRRLDLDIVCRGAHWLGGHHLCGGGGHGEGEI